MKRILMLCSLMLITTSVLKAQASVSIINSSPCTIMLDYTATTAGCGVPTTPPPYNFGTGVTMSPGDTLTIIDANTTVGNYLISNITAGGQPIPDLYADPGGACTPTSTSTSTVPIACSLTNVRATASGGAGAYTVTFTN